MKPANSVLASFGTTVFEVMTRLAIEHQTINLGQGEILIFPVRERPIQGKRGHFRAPMRHGVSRLHTGLRYTLGVIFHDAA